MYPYRMVEKRKELMIGGVIKKIEILLTAKSNRYLQKFNITWSQAQILKYLAMHAKATNTKIGEPTDVFQKDLEEFFGLSNPTVTGLLNRLEAKDLVKRDIFAQDRRWKRLILTQKGYEIQEKSFDGFVKMESELLETFSKDEREIFIKCLNSLYESLAKEKNFTF